MATQSTGKIIITQAERLFDLRMVPSGHRRDVAHETTALIREAIARVPLPKLDEIPDEDEMAARVMAGKSLVYPFRTPPSRLPAPIRDLTPAVISLPRRRWIRHGTFTRRSKPTLSNPNRPTSRACMRPTSCHQGRSVSNLELT